MPALALCSLFFAGPCAVQSRLCQPLHCALSSLPALCAVLSLLLVAVAVAVVVVVVVVVDVVVVVVVVLWLLSPLRRPA